MYFTIAYELRLYASAPSVSDACWSGNESSPRHEPARRSASGLPMELIVMPVGHHMFDRSQVLIVRT
jgi:hypothetical protein